MRVEDEHGRVLWRQDEQPAVEVESRAGAIAIASQAVGWPYDLVPQDVTDPNEIAALQAMTSGPATTAPVRLVLEAKEVGSSIVLQSTGLRRVQGGIVQAVVAEERWAPVHVDPAILSIPAPQGHLRSDLGDWAADLVGWGPYRFLIVGGPQGQATTYALQQATGFPERVLAGAAVGVAGAVRVDDWCPLDRLTYVRLRNAELVARDIEFVHQPQGVPALDDDSNAIAGIAAKVASQFTRLGTFVDARPLDPTPAVGLRSVLDDSCDSDLRRVSLGMRVHDSWSSAAGTVEFSYDFRPDSLVGFVQSADFRRPVNVLTVDRAGHLAESVTECAYCSTVTCQQCVDGVTGCPLCSIAICARCRGHETLCLACRDLRPSGRLRGLGKPGLHGEDAVHHVDVTPAEGDGANVITASGDEQFQFRAALDEALAQRLNAVVKRQVFAAGGGSTR